jgi:hypothetical protein
MLPISKTLDNSPKLGGALLQDGLNSFLQTFRQDLGTSRQIATHTAFLGSNLVTGDQEGKQANTENE